MAYFQIDFVSWDPKKELFESQTRRPLANKKMATGPAKKLFWDSENSISIKLLTFCSYPGFCFKYDFCLLYDLLVLHPVLLALKVGE